MWVPARQLTEFKGSSEENKAFLDSVHALNAGEVAAAATCGQVFTESGSADRIQEHLLSCESRPASPDAL